MLLIVNAGPPEFFDGRSRQAAFWLRAKGEKMAAGPTTHDTTSATRAAQHRKQQPTTAKHPSTTLQRGVWSIIEPSLLESYIGHFCWIGWCVDWIGGSEIGADRQAFGTVHHVAPYRIAIAPVCPSVTTSPPLLYPIHIVNGSSKGTFAPKQRAWLEAAVVFAKPNGRRTYFQ